MSLLRYLGYAGFLGLFAAACTGVDHVQQPTVEQQSTADQFTAEQLMQLPLADVTAMADRGNAKALTELAVRYSTGRDVDKSVARAIELLEKAAALQDAFAIFNLGTAYLNGIGVPQDDAKALARYKQASDLGNIDAAYWAGMMLGWGRGSDPASWSVARPYLEKAASHDYVDAQFQLGWMYHEGQGVEVDYEKAAAWYRRSASRVLNQKAQYNLLLLINEKKINWRIGDPLPAEPAPQPAPNAP